MKTDYQTRQKQWVLRNKLRKGDMVEVVSQPFFGEKDWNIHTNAEMTAGRKLRVVRVIGSGIVLSDHYTYPYFSLKIVGKRNENRPFFYPVNQSSYALIGKRSVQVRDVRFPWSVLEKAVKDAEVLEPYAERAEYSFYNDGPYVGIGCQHVLKSTLSKVVKMRPR